MSSRSPPSRYPMLRERLLSLTFLRVRRTRAERVASGDPRLSLEERYTDHAGYVEAVNKAAAHTVAQKFLLQKDADAMIRQAEGSGVLK